MSIKKYINFTVDSRGSCLDDKKKPYHLPPFLLYGILNCMVMKEIELTRGRVTLVDDEDYDYLMQWSWHLHKNYRSNQYYAVSTVPDENWDYNKRIWMHRLIMNTPKGLEVDHIDHNGLNNQKSNLRNCTRWENAKNRVSVGKSCYRGVSVKQNGRYEAYIRINGKITYLGSSKDELIVAKMYDEAAKKYHGEFANLNFKE